MQRPPARRLGLAAGCLCLIAAAPAAAQQPAPGDVGLSLTARAFASALVTLVVAGGLVALVPEYVERTTDRILDAPGETFIYGVGIGVVAVIVAVVLVFTVVGIVVSVPILIALAVVGYLGFLAAGRVVSESWGAAVAVAVAVAVVTGGVPVLGGLVGFVLNSMGIGAAYLDYRGDGTRQTRGDTRRSGAAGGSGYGSNRAGSRTRKRRSGPPSGSGTGSDGGERDGSDPGSSR